MTLEESANSNDNVTEIDGIKFVITDNQSIHFNNSKLDYIHNTMGFGEFKILKI
jgi:Fe-S cluster assembly iron-binding protein IscA